MEPNTTTERLTAALQCLPEPLRLELVRQVARISEQAFRRGAQQAADHKLDYSLATHIRFNVSYDEHPIYIGNFAPGTALPVTPHWCRTSIERVAMEVINADAPGLEPLFFAAAKAVRCVEPHL
ncbi:MAG: hypothetical protein NTZ40_10365 [Cyanobacteria bacterium]|nr:hypothetical protein [Cyanobacteriota bacterium]